MLRRGVTSSHKYEELLGILIEYQWTFEVHLLDIVQNFLKKKTHPCKNIKVHDSKEAENFHENISHNFHIVH